MSIKIECNVCGANIPIGQCGIKGEHQYYVDGSRFFHWCKSCAAIAVGAFKPGAIRAVLAERERELLELKGPCSNEKCQLHFAHSGPCGEKQ
jgi:hypothetical protein